LDVFVHDRVTGTTERVSVASNGAEGNDFSGWQAMAISPDGRYVAFDSYASNLVPGQPNITGSRVFFHHRLAGTTKRARPAFEDSGDACIGISGGGRYLVFDNLASSGFAYALYNRVTGHSKRLAILDPYRESCAIDAQGRFVAFNGINFAAL